MPSHPPPPPISTEALAGTALLLGAGSLAYGGVVLDQALDDRSRLEDVEAQQRSAATQLEAVARFEQAVGAGDQRFPVGNADLPGGAAPLVDLDGDVLPVRGDVQVTETEVTVRLLPPYVRSATTLGVGLSSSATQNTLDVRIRRPLYTALVGDGVPPSADPNAHQYATIAEAVAAGQGASIRVVGATRETQDITWPRSARLLLDDGAEVRVEGGRWTTALAPPSPLTPTGLTVVGAGLLVLGSNAGGDWVSAFARVAFGRGLTLQVLGTQRVSAASAVTLDRVTATGTAQGNRLHVTAPVVRLARCDGASTLGVTAVASTRVQVSHVTGWGGGLDCASPDVFTRLTTGDLTVRGCLSLRCEGDQRANLVLTDPPAGPGPATRSELWNCVVTGEITLVPGTTTATPRPHDVAWTNTTGGAAVKLDAQCPLRALRCVGGEFGALNVGNTDSPAPAAPTWHLQRCRFGGNVVATPPTAPAPAPTPDLLVQGCTFAANLDWQCLGQYLELSDSQISAQATVSLAVARRGGLCVLRNAVPLAAQDPAAAGCALALRGGRCTVRDNALGVNATLQVTTSSTSTPADVDWATQGVDVSHNELARATVAGTFDMHNVRFAHNTLRANTAVVADAGLRLGLNSASSHRAQNTHVTGNRGAVGDIKLGGGVGGVSLAFVRFTFPRVDDNEVANVTVEAEPLESAQVKRNRCTGGLSLQANPATFPIQNTLGSYVQLEQNTIEGALQLWDLGGETGTTARSTLTHLNIHDNEVQGVFTLGPNLGTKPGFSACDYVSMVGNYTGSTNVFRLTSSPTSMRAVLISRHTVRNASYIGWVLMDQSTLRACTSRVGRWSMFSSSTKPCLLTDCAFNHNNLGGLTIEGASGGNIVNATCVGNYASSLRFGMQTNTGLCVCYNRNFSSTTVRYVTSLLRCTIFGNNCPSELAVQGNGTIDQLTVHGNTVNQVLISCYPADSATRVAVGGNSVYSGNPSLDLTPANTVDKGNWVLGNVLTYAPTGFVAAETQLAGADANRVVAP